MKRLFWLVLLMPLLLISSDGARSQSTAVVNINDGVTVSNTPRAGLNLELPSESTPSFKNYFAFSNHSFEQLLYQQIWQIQSTCSSCTALQFQWNVSNTQYENYDANQWAGATFTVIQGSYASGASDPSLNCTGTIASSANQSGAGPIFTINAATNQGASGCAGGIGLPGQVIIGSTNSSMTNVSPTPTAYWNNGGNQGALFGFQLSGGATMASETTDVCATCGQQALLFTVPSGGSVFMQGGPALNFPSEKSVVLNGTYTFSYWAKSTGGSPKISLLPVPRGGPSCTTDNYTVTTSWVQHSMTCTMAESPTVGGPYPFVIQYTVTSTSGTSTVEFDNVSMTNNADNNPTMYTNAYVNTLKAWCQSQNTTGAACTLRYPSHPDSETIPNLLKSFDAAQPTYEDFHEGISTAFPNVYTPYYTFLQLNAHVGAIPVLITPSTMTVSDAECLIDYLQDNAGTTTCGAIRVAQGQTTAWVGATGSPFSQILLEFSNENWNGAFLGHVWGFNNSAPGFNGFYDYSVRANVIFSAARSYQTSQGYSQTPTKWVLNYTPADKGGNLYYNGGQGVLATAHPDIIEFNGYTGFNVNQTNSSCTSNANCELYGATLTEPWANTHDTASVSGAYQTMAALKAHNLCGPSGTAACQGMIYEENIGTSNTTTSPYLVWQGGTYTSGGTISGSTGQNCGLSFTTGGGTGGTGYVVLTGTNTIASGSLINVLNSGSAYTSEYLTSATLSNGVTEGSSTGATCSGTATVNQLTDQMTQAVADTYIQAGVQGVVTADQLGENDAAGIVSQNYFTLSQYYFNQGGVNVHMWGVNLDEGGDASVYNAATFGGNYMPRPQMLGAMVYNSCKIGPMVQTTWPTNTTYNLPANFNSVNALNSVPMLKSFAFSSGTNRCMVVVNSDVANSYTVSFTGTNAPTTGVTTYQFAPSSLSSVNEASALNQTSTTAATMSNTTATGVNVSSGYTVPAHSVTAFSWSTSGGAGPVINGAQFSGARFSGGIRITFP